MLRKIIITLLLALTSISTLNYVNAETSEPSYTTLTRVDLNTFNEYRYRITEQYFNLKSYFRINGSVDKNVARKIETIAKKGYNYLPDNLANKNLLNNLKTSIARGIKYPDNESNYTDIVKNIQAYLEKTDIQKVKGSVEVYPKEGNAPFTATFRANVVDPTGTKIPKYNYIWWMNVGGKRKVIGTTSGPSLNYTFREEGNFSVFLDVSSNHKNVKGYTDVLPFRSRADVKVKEKIASLIIKINRVNLRQKSKIKFTPDESRYGLLFDATSSTPTSGTKFVRTTWDFGNGIEKDYDGAPRIERVVYNKEGDFPVKLKLRTNEGKVVERKFTININDPIATIKSSLETGFLGDKFTFSAQNSGNDDDLTYNWEIIDIDNDKVIYSKSQKLFTYSFKNKGKYNVRLKVTEPSSTNPDVDTKIIYINSRTPEANFTYSVPFKNKPNTVLLDATKSYDPDFSDEGKLRFTWIINGERLTLDNANYNGSIGYYTFDSIGDHSVVLEVKDPDDIISQKTQKVVVNSILSVDFNASPRVITRDQKITFNAVSPEAEFFEWDFGDGEKFGGKEKTVSHKYKKSGVFKVRLRVLDSNDKQNFFEKNVYVGESNSPLAFVNVTNNTLSEVTYRPNTCEGEPAYILNRVDSIRFDGSESIDITGKNTGLSYSWKTPNNKFYSSSSFSKKFDELGCFKVQLKVTSDKNGKTSTKNIWVKVENLKPTISSLDVKVTDDTTDPVIVKIDALGAKDRDGVIQSYLWYYYTDTSAGEPQDFRATRGPSTTFVLPKVTGNYYFVAVMKDNNEARITSEEITGSKYFITLAGDNINTPIVDLDVSDSSVSLGEEVIFNAKVTNVLGQDISKKVKYSWDLDGDGFYEKQTNIPQLIYKFNKSGEFYSKVKAKYKGFSNTKSSIISVANIIKPNFDYISIGNEFIFLDKSIGKYDTIDWNLGDKTTYKKGVFSHKYEDNKTSHLVELKISDNTKIKTLKRKVVKNMKNFILSRNGDLVIFSSPSKKDDKITLDEKDKVYLYLKSNNKEAKKYIVDFDLDFDSDLNGGNDDDIDNKDSESYTKSAPILIKLNKNRTQKLRVSVLNENDEIISKEDILIEKKYIEENINISSLEFNGISESEKIKLEKLKNYINSLPKEHKLKASMYLQKLKEEWFDDREKTNVIIEFENYLAEVDINSTQAIDILESLLVEGEEDKSEKAIMFKALKNLIPKGITCLGLKENENCYDLLISKLEVIKNNKSIEENKVLGKDILNVIADDTVMTNKQKLDFKEILKLFIYGGVSNIPKSELETESNENTSNDDETSGLISFVSTLLFWIFIIFLVFVFIVLGYYFVFRLTNKNKNIGFQDFIIEKTSNKKVVKQETNSDILEDDLLTDLNEEEKQEEVIENKVHKEVPKKEIKETETEKAEENPFLAKTEASKENEEVKTEIKTEKSYVVEEKKSDDTVHTNEVPDWLKGSFSDEKQQEKKEEKVEEPKTEDKKETKKTETKETKEEKVNPSIDKSSENEEEKLPTNEQLEDLTKIEDSSKNDDDNIPDWLKGSFGDEKQKETKEEKVEESKIEVKKETNKTEKEKSIDKVKEDNKETEKIKEPNQEKTNSSIVKNSKSKDKEPKKEVEKKDTLKTTKKATTKKTSNQKKKAEETKKITTKKTEIKKDSQKDENEQKKQEKTSKNNKDLLSESQDKKNKDLWDDGMKVPDWLKTDDK